MNKKASDQQTQSNKVREPKTIAQFVGKKEGRKK